jgi:hypothetical protein
MVTTTAFIGVPRAQPGDLLESRIGRHDRDQAMPIGFRGAIASGAPAPVVQNATAGCPSCRGRCAAGVGAGQIARRTGDLEPAGLGQRGK